MSHIPFRPVISLYPSVLPIWTSEAWLYTIHVEKRKLYRQRSYRVFLWAHEGWDRYIQLWYDSGSWTISRKLYILLQQPQASMVKKKDDPCTIQESSLTITTLKDFYFLSTEWGAVHNGVFFMFHMVYSIIILTAYLAKYSPFEPPPHLVIGQLLIVEFPLK